MSDRPAFSIPPPHQGSEKGHCPAAGGPESHPGWPTAAQPFSPLLVSLLRIPAAEAPCQSQVQTFPGDSLPSGMFQNMRPLVWGRGYPRWPWNLRIEIWTGFVSNGHWHSHPFYQNLGGPGQRKAGPAWNENEDILECILHGRGQLTTNGLRKALLLFPSSSQKKEKKRKGKEKW